jgi:hypothetical protein
MVDHASHKLLALARVRRITPEILYLARVGFEIVQFAQTTSVIVGQLPLHCIVGRRIRQTGSTDGGCGDVIWILDKGA